MLSLLLLLLPAQASVNAKPLFVEGFDDAKLLERGWYDGARFKISGTEPQAGTGSVEYHWLAGSTNPESTQTVRRLFQPSESVFVRFHMRLSSGWAWTGKGFHPHMIQLMTTENGKFQGPAASHLTLYIEPQEGRLRLAAQDIQNKDSKHGLTQGPLKGGYNGTFWDSKDVLFKDDRWHRVEAVFKLNGLRGEQPVADGVVRGWFDGKLVIDRSDVVLRSADFPSMKINQFLLAPYFGPGLLPHEQTLWIDELLVGVPG
jgi:hypothetical protein